MKPTVYAKNASKHHQHAATGAARAEQPKHKSDDEQSDDEFLENLEKEQKEKVDVSKMTRRQRMTYFQ